MKDNKPQQGGPISAIGKPRPPVDIGDTTALREQQELMAEQSALDAKNSVAANKVAMALGATWFATDYTWPFLLKDNRQLSVSEFYPELKIAIDKFYHVGDFEKSVIEFKLKVLNDNGIRYGALTFDKSLADLSAELDDQEREMGIR